MYQAILHSKKMESAQEYMENKFLLRESVRTIACEIGTQAHTDITGI
jgi:hypothetical protein